MKLRALLIGAAFVVTPWLAHANELARDIQDMVFLSDARPIVIRLHIEVDGKAFQERWEGFLSRLYQHLDRDGDGVLSESEAGRAYSPPQMMLVLRGGFFQAVAAAPNVAEMDVDGDGKITAEELQNYYRRNGAGPLSAQAGPTRGPQDPVTDALFKQLDANKDGKLTRGELAAAADVLAKLDLDDDELVSVAELIPGANPFAYQAQVQLPRGGVAAPNVLDNSDFFVVIPDGSPKRLTQRLQLTKKILAKYDKDSNDRLSKTEIGLDDATFQRLDLNKDDSLDSTELLKLLNPPADIELALRLGRLGAGVSASEILMQDGKAAPLAAVARKTATGSVMLTLGETQLELRRSEGQVNTFANYRQYFQQLFRALDKDKQGFVQLKDLQAQQNQMLKNLFPMADRDGDGRMTEKELDAFADLLASAANCTTTLTFGDNGNGLFEMLDANRDGRLNVPELRSMWARLEPFDRDKDGGLIRSELPRQLQIGVSPGTPLNFGRQVVNTAPAGMNAPGMATEGPLWFRMMDRNSCGVVSRREFFGSDEDFRRIDTDNSGYITRAEAEAADKAMRKR